MLIKMNRTASINGFKNCLEEVVQNKSIKGVMNEKR